MFVGQIEDLLAHCGVGTNASLAGVAGSSLGAIIAAYYAKIRPGRVERLCLFNPVSFSFKFSIVCHAFLFDFFLGRAGLLLACIARTFLANPLVLAAKLLYLAGRAPGLEATVMLCQTVIKFLLYPMRRPPASKATKGTFSSVPFALGLAALWAARSLKQKAIAQNTYGAFYGLCIGAQGYKSRWARVLLRTIALYLIAASLMQNRRVNKLFFDGWFDVGNG